MKERAVPELFERLIGDVEQLAGDLERLQRFVELCGGAAAPAAPPDPAAPEIPLSWPQPPAPPAAPEPMEEIPSSAGGQARAEMEAKAKDTAEEMVRRMKWATEEGWSLPAMLAWVIREMSKASQKFQCPQTMAAILKALDDMHLQQATTEEANG